MNELLTLAWLIINSLAVAGLFVFNLAQWHNTRKRMDALDLSERLQYLITRVDRDMVKRNRELHDGLAEAIRVFEDNKMLCERYWSEIQQLKKLL